ncbi:hypothetical protein OIU77_026158 [Salix suchowensis]|uniref:protein-disulfide reductase n=1 Tax=Salix suchowensis TaxID=1278906 RepID=A0ABQ9C2W7_9ROSI|nr:hypothetical protein OIU77_026158 [Salix suchowensis]
MTGKTIGLYFSAQWCHPGVKFTPRLISIYQKIKQVLVHKGTEDDFEIVFVSSDRDQATFDSYFNGMPWLALPFGDPANKILAKHFYVKCIPSLKELEEDRLYAVIVMNKVQDGLTCALNADMRCTPSVLELRTVAPWLRADQINVFIFQL